MTEQVAPFAPSEVDIVSTKLRTWNLSHPGNVFYTELVHKMVPSIKFDDPTEYRRVATEIVDILTIERQGRFLKLKEGTKDPTSCLVMDRKQCLNKVVHALRTAQSKMENVILPPGPKKKKTPEKEKDGSNTDKVHRKRTKPKRGADESFAYKARAGEKSIDRYTLKLISLVCNQQDPPTAFKVLDDPIEQCSPEDEPDKHRLMRLQMRHRFASATAAGMTPLDFAAKLLKLWGGMLAEVKVRPAKEKSGKEGTDKGLSTPAANDQMVSPDSKKIKSPGSTTESPQPEPSQRDTVKMDVSSTPGADVDESQKETSPSPAIASIEKRATPPEFEQPISEISMSEKAPSEQNDTGAVMES